MKDFGLFLCSNASQPRLHADPPSAPKNRAIFVRDGSGLQYFWSKSAGR
jgi:hypothetical protein